MFKTNSWPSLSNKCDTPMGSRNFHKIAFKDFSIFYKCVQRELLPEPRSSSACRHTTIDYLSDQWCVWPKMWWSNKRLGGSVLILKNNNRSVIWQRHGGRADNSNRTANNAKYTNCKGLNHETYDVSLQNLRSRPFWILSPLRILFLSILRLFTS